MTHVLFGRVALAAVQAAVCEGWRARQTFAVEVQVDTLGKKLLVGVAVGYVGLVLLVPTLNVFVQVRQLCSCAALRGAAPQQAASNLHTWPGCCSMREVQHSSCVMHTLPSFPHGEFVLVAGILKGDWALFHALERARLPTCGAFL